MAEPLGAIELSLAPVARVVQTPPLGVAVVEVGEEPQRRAVAVLLISRVTKVHHPPVRQSRLVLLVLPRAPRYPVRGRHRY